ncbi:MAG: hypothetical protein ACRDRL_24245 [Sciscionella sp.]
MIDIAIGMVATYLGRKAAKLAGHAAEDVDKQVDSLLGRLYDVVKGKVLGLGKRGERSLEHLERRPDDDRSRQEAREDLAEALANDPESRAAVAAILAELRQADPDGVRLRGYAKSYHVAAGATNLGAELKGTPQSETSVDGTAETVFNDGDNIGARIEIR